MAFGGFGKAFAANTIKNNQLNAQGMKHPMLAGLALGANSMMNPGSTIGQRGGGAAKQIGAGINTGPSPAMKPPPSLMPPPLPMGPMPPMPQGPMPMGAPPMQPDIVQPPTMQPPSPNGNYQGMLQAGLFGSGRDPRRRY